MSSVKHQVSCHHITNDGLFEISGKQIINEMMQKLDRYRFKPVAAVPEVLRPTTEAVIHHPEVTEAASLATRRLDKPHKFTPSERLDVASELGEELRPYRGPCNCSKLIMSSNNPVTLSKHGGELGQYSLVGGMAGRPVYRHVARPSYLFYQPESGGNWLVNNRPGQLYGGIQNSKVRVMMIRTWNNDKLSGLSRLSVPAEYSVAVRG